MNTHMGRWSILTQRRGQVSGHIALLVLIGLAVETLSSAARADDFADVYYSARMDQLVITIAYRGTNPNHTFSLKWGQCKNQTQDGGGEVAVEVLDSQSQDVEQSDFKKTTRFSLAHIPCRPATLTLRSAPRFLATLTIPQKPAQKP